MMKTGICELALVSVRKQAGDQHEMVNQLLFGDLIRIKDQVSTWLLIESIDDGYEGWIDEKQIKILADDHNGSHDNVAATYVNDIYAVAISEKHNRHICLGSRLPFYDEGSFTIGANSYKTDCQTTRSPITFETVNLVQTARKFLGSPYLWGGRSVFGLDCSGFVQIVYKMNGLLLPRDASLQVDKGDVVDFISEAREGDLAYFDNEEGNITHVGIIMSDQKIIHASGEVRIDNLDHQGIFNEEKQQYTHKLRVIKRFPVN